MSGLGTEGVIILSRQEAKGKVIVQEIHTPISRELIQMLLKYSKNNPNTMYFDMAKVCFLENKDAVYVALRRKALDHAELAKIPSLRELR